LQIQQTEKERISTILIVYHIILLDGSTTVSLSHSKRLSATQVRRQFAMQRTTFGEDVSLKTEVHGLIDDIGDGGDSGEIMMI
jgi:hypothetical protein